MIKLNYYWHLVTQIILLSLAGVLKKCITNFFESSIWVCGALMAVSFSHSHT